MIYYQPQTGRQIDVGDGEPVKRLILERAGWTTTPGEPLSAVAPAAPAIDAGAALRALLGIGNEIAAALVQAGLGTPDALRQADDRALLAIPGIGKATLAKIRSQL